jgi:hypothetical protein
MMAKEVILTEYGMTTSEFTTSWMLHRHHSNIAINTSVGSKRSRESSRGVPTVPDIGSIAE